jgi:sulfatase maturation enzyme AslB (radical SAM superfamily)
MYKCTFCGTGDVLHYDTHKNLLYKNNKVLKVKNNTLINDDRYSIRLTLGRNCNLRCAYCIQCNARENFKNELSVDDFIGHLKNFMGKKKIHVIEFWGGEPLVYFNKLKELHKKFVEKLNVKSFWFATNGALLTDEITDFLIQNNFYISISYDGDGQSLRGYDLEHDKKVVNNIKRINDKKLLAFLPVMTNLNKSMSRYQENVKNMIGTDEFCYWKFSSSNCCY